MNEKKTTFLEKVKTLPLEELLELEVAAIQAGRVVDVIGIACVLVMLFFPLTVILIIGFPITLLLANTGVNIGMSLNEIRRHLQNLKKS